MHASSIRPRATQSYRSESASGRLISCLGSFLLPLLQAQSQAHTPSSHLAVLLPLRSAAWILSGVLCLMSPGTASILNETLGAVRANSSTSIFITHKESVQSRRGHS